MNPRDVTDTMAPLHARIAAALGWSEADVQGFSLPSLRDFVRPVDPALADEVSACLRGSAAYVRQPSHLRYRP